MENECIYSEVRNIMTGQKKIDKHLGMQVKQEDVVSRESNRLYGVCGLKRKKQPLPTVRARRLQDWLKRWIDIGASSTLIVLLSPVMAVIALIIWATSKGGVLFRQTRLTQYGSTFELYKFRSMFKEAEQESGAVFAQRADVRVTAVGRVLRKTRLDELPQLWNVLKGDMSLIGPRPERPELAGNLNGKIRGFQHRLQVKAGLTGLAQVIQGYPDGVHGYRRKLGLDRLYIKKQSFLFDLWILVRTVGVVLTGSGAR